MVEGKVVSVTMAQADKVLEAYKANKPLVWAITSVEYYVALEMIDCARGMLTPQQCRKNCKKIADESQVPGLTKKVMAAYQENMAKWTGALGK